MTEFLAQWKEIYTQSVQPRLPASLVRHSRQVVVVRDSGVGAEHSGASSVELAVVAPVSASFHHGVGCCLVLSNILLTLTPNISLLLETN